MKKLNALTLYFKFDPLNLCGFHSHSRSTCFFVSLLLPPAVSIPYFLYSTTILVFMSEPEPIPTVSNREIEFVWRNSCYSGCSLFTAITHVPFRRCLLNQLKAMNSTENSVLFHFYTTLDELDLNLDIISKYFLEPGPTHWVPSGTVRQGSDIHPLAATRPNTCD